MIRKFVTEIGPLWGDSAMQTARLQIKDDAQRFSVALRKFAILVQPGAYISDRQFDAIGLELTPFKQNVFQAAVELHAGVLRERQRVGIRISVLESRL